MREGKKGTGRDLPGCGRRWRSAALAAQRVARYGLLPTARFMFLISRRIARWPNEPPTAVRSFLMHALTAETTGKLMKLAPSSPPFSLRPCTPLPGLGRTAVPQCSPLYSSARTASAAHRGVALYPAFQVVFRTYRAVRTQCGVAGRMATSAAVGGSSIVEKGSRLSK